MARRIVSGADDATVQVGRSGRAELLILRGHEGPVWAAAFSLADGARIVSGADDATVRVWDAANRAELLVLRGHEGTVYDAGFSSDGARIVSGSDDKEAVRRCGTRRGRAERCWSCAATRGGSLRQRSHRMAARVIERISDSTVRVSWIGRTKRELIEIARTSLPRELTDDERVACLCS